MSVNNVQYTGGDPKWAREVEAIITEQQQQIAFLVAQLANVNRRINKV